MKNLYNREKVIANLAKRKLQNYGNYKERAKKENELFHLLCFLDINKKIDLYDNIEPHEPGDFIININDKKIMIEVVECFGNPDTYMDVVNKLNNIFKRKIYRPNQGKYSFTIKESIDQFRAVFINKNENKEYLNNKEFDKTILLLVTGEYENCSITGNWIEKFLEEKDFDINQYDKICVIDYFASMKDGGPSIMKNVLEEIKEYKNIFK